MEWLDAVDEDRTFLSVVSIGELRRGVDRLADGRRKDALTGWLVDELPGRFEGRMLGVDLAVANAWGRMRARTDAVGKPLGPIDALLAATAESHRLEVVTRNVAHFEPAGVAIVNPWTN
jgi:predicted nucleic acid-binding protein